MRINIDKRRAAAFLTFSGLFVAAIVVAANDDMTPSEWLDQMDGAVQTINYEGTVVREKDRKLETFEVVHTVTDGVVREKVIFKDGNGLEIIRNGNEVHCIFPDRESVLVEEWNDQSTLFSTLPSSDIQFGSEYDVSIVDFERIAGRKAVALAIRPHDNYRYGHRVWLDVKTGFPLQTQLIGDGGEPLEQVKFADIRIDAAISPNALTSSYSTEGWKWFTQPQKRARQEVDAPWISDNVPAGFRVVSTHQESLSDDSSTVIHILYSDGLASVSVFVAPSGGKKKSKRSSAGASNSYTTENGDFIVTAVGEVPWATVEQIAESMRLNQ
jgi:sigma-E factor negative regulatory protein RseB